LSDSERDATVELEMRACKRVQNYTLVYRNMAAVTKFGEK